MFGFFIRQKKNIRCIKMRKENYAYYNLQMIQAKAIWICAKINCNTICSDTGLQWTTELFIILGVTYTANLKKNTKQLNVDKKLKLVQN